MSTGNTHWKKNNDSTYISGEDLQNELNGLRKDFPVKLVRFKDGETFDAKSQQKATKTIIYFTDLTGKELYKGVVLNNTAGEFFAKEFKSPIMENWLGQTCSIYAKADSRHGFVVRFKKYYAPAVQVDIKGAKEILNSSESMEDLGANWTKLNQLQQLNSEVEKLKDSLKEKLSN